MSDNSNPTILRWERQKTALLSELALAEEVTFRIPGWQPVGLSEALRWMQASIFEGFYVESRVASVGRTATVWVKIWENGEREPSWESIMEPKGSD